MANQTALKNKERLRKISRDAIATEQGGALTKGPEDQRKKQAEDREKKKGKAQKEAGKERKSAAGTATDRRLSEKAPLEGTRGYAPPAGREKGYSDPHTNR